MPALGCAKISAEPVALYSDPSHPMAAWHMEHHEQHCRLTAFSMQTGMWLIINIVTTETAIERDKALGRKSDMANPVMF